MCITITTSLNTQHATDSRVERDESALGTGACDECEACVLCVAFDGIDGGDISNRSAPRLRTGGREGIEIA